MSHMQNISHTQKQFLSILVASCVSQKQFLSILVASFICMISPLSLYATPHITPKTAKILVVTPTSNHPEFIALQDKSFKKYLKDDYTFVVFNDAKDGVDAYKINQACAALNI